LKRNAARSPGDCAYPGLSLSGRSNKFILKLSIQLDGELREHGFEDVGQAAGKLAALKGLGFSLALSKPSSHRSLKPVPSDF
jgi:hypothetical protein